MPRLLIATSNPAKLAEYRLLLRDYDLEPISLKDAGISEAPEESGEDFAANALLKARFYFERAQIPTLADDGGLEIDALGGAPGVHSHRWLDGREASDEMLVAEVIRRMANVEPSRRTARLRNATALVYRIDGETRERITEGSLEGVIASTAYSRIRQGFPYRAVLFLPERGCYLGELGDEEEARISQRRIAIGRAAPWLGEIASLG